MSRWGFGVFVLAAVLALLPAIQADAAAADNGRIAFVSPSSGHLKIFSAEPDGTRIRFLAEGSAPSWSPDAKRLAYITEAGSPLPTQQSGQIAIRRLDGSIVFTGVPAFGLDMYSEPGLAWSPDGLRLAYGFREEIWVMNAAPPYDPHRVVSRLSSSPSWSPDSQKLVFAGFEPLSGRFEIFTIKADGTGETNITNTPSIDESAPDWSPDGGRFAFRADGGFLPTGVWIMNANGAARHFLADTSTFCCGSPQWAPDGTRIAFVSSDAQIATISPDGTRLSVMTTGCGESFEPAWDRLLLHQRIQGRPGRWCSR